MIEDEDVQQSAAPEPAPSREAYVWCGMVVRRDAVRSHTKPTEVRKYEGGGLRDLGEALA